MRKQVIISVIFMITLFVSIIGAKVVETNMDDFYEVSILADSSRIVQWEIGADTTHKRPQIISYYRGDSVIAVEVVGYCKPIDSRRFEARCFDKEKYYADSTLLDSIKIEQEKAK